MSVKIINNQQYYLINHYFCKINYAYCKVIALQIMMHYCKNKQ